MRMLIDSDHQNVLVQGGKCLNAFLVPLPKDSHANKFSTHGLDTICTTYVSNNYFSFSAFHIQAVNEDSEPGTIISAFIHTEKLTASAC